MDKLETFCEKYGFITDDKKAGFKCIFSNNSFKTLHMDMYTLDPYMLFMRSIENNPMVAIENDRIIIRKKDKYKTHIMDILFDHIDNCIIKEYSNVQYEIIFAIHNVYCKLLIII